MTVKIYMFINSLFRDSTYDLLFHKAFSIKLNSLCVCSQLNTFKYNQGVRDLGQ